MSGKKVLALLMALLLLTAPLAAYGEENKPTATPEPTATPTAEPTATPTPEPTATATTEPTATPTAEPTATPTPEPTATATTEPTATPTTEPTATPTPEFTATATPEPTASPTAEPTATPTPEPTVTATPEPTATSTEEPTATPTPETTATAMPEPTSTPTVGITETPTPETTATVEPTITPEATEPTATPEASVTPSADAAATPEPTGTTTPDPTAAASEEPTPTPDPSPLAAVVPEVQTYSHIFDLSQPDTLSYALHLAPLETCRISITQTYDFAFHDAAAVSANAASAGSRTANRNVALTAAGTSITTETEHLEGIANENGDLFFHLTHYSAITVTDTEPLPLISLRIESAQEVSDLTFSLKRQAAQIRATVPLVLVMQTGLNGGTASLADTGYGIVNESGMDIQLTAIEEAVGSTAFLKQAAANADLAAQTNHYRINYHHTADTLPQIIHPGSQNRFNPISSIALSPLTFTTPNAAQAVRLATLTYKVSILE